jgi:hypothetical protein
MEDFMKQVVDRFKAQIETAEVSLKGGPNGSIKGKIQGVPEALIFLLVISMMRDPKIKTVVKSAIMAVENPHVRDLFKELVESKDISFGEKSEVDELNDEALNEVLRKANIGRAQKEE